MFMGSLDSLPLLRKGRSRTINWENRTGEKGKGGMAASDLGAFPERLTLYSLPGTGRNGDACGDGRPRCNSAYMDYGNGSYQ